VTEWASQTIYKVGSVVTFGGSHFRCIQAHTSVSTWTPPATPSLWRKFGPGDFFDKKVASDIFTAEFEGRKLFENLTVTRSASQVVIAYNVPAVGHVTPRVFVLATEVQYESLLNGNLLLVSRQPFDGILESGCGTPFGTDDSGLRALAPSLGESQARGLAGSAIQVLSEPAVEEAINAAVEVVRPLPGVDPPPPDCSMVQSICDTRRNGCRAACTVLAAGIIYVGSDVIRAICTAGPVVCGGAVVLGVLGIGAAGCMLSEV
jgi:hypothetical protein